MPNSHRQQNILRSTQVHIAYVEIYNEAGYDLLDPAREGAVAGFGDLPRVGVLEDDDGRLHMRNLSLHCATTEEEALNLVITGLNHKLYCPAITESQQLLVSLAHLRRTGNQFPVYPPQQFSGVAAPVLMLRQVEWTPVFCYRQRAARLSEIRSV